ncbi:hypothetical protein JOF56_000880 [Kibdelosporangium banguiense]|uniref:SH3 domain-containing protein n=1 Tax=Kibdelosporangium banguiense TaxID=1365924 RepID=A0ABS4T8S9_9PSEU|nr:hypothetical protein [Kibdelosporangium banguiense]MBP2320495.1 hypothetical protein [Kibdelosporangium banguiense]
MNRLKLLAFAVLAALGLLASLNSVATADVATTKTSTADVSVQVVRTLCYANDVDVRYVPGGSPTGRLVYRYQTVNVVDYRDGVWWQINSPYSGYVLAQYFC